MAYADSGIEPVRRPRRVVRSWTADPRRDVAGARPAFDAAFIREAIRELKPVYARVERVIPPLEWAAHAPYIKAIRDLKREKNAVILAHNYMTPEIFHGVGDILGDSLQLAREAAKTDADVIVQCGVHFMAETAKLMNPDKTVLIPDPDAGCSLAESVTPEDVRALRAAYPGVPVVTYVNTSAAVKAECDICCTSANAVQVVESLGAPRVLLIPDEYLARYVASQTSVEVIAWKGRCEVHERFTGERAAPLPRDHPGREDRRPSRMPAGRDRGGRLHRLDQRHDQVGEAASAGTRCSCYGMLDGQQRRLRGAGYRFHAALQHVPAYEADLAAEDPGQPDLDEDRGHGGPGDRRPCAHSC